MSLNRIISRVIRNTKDRLYTGRLRRIVRYFGCHDWLRKRYWELLHLLSGDITTKSIANHTIRFHASSITEFRRFQQFFGEEPIITDLLENLGSDDIFYDIGANVGTYTCFATSELGPYRTVAFEPEPRNAARLRENLRLNDLDADVIELALSETNGTVKLALDTNGVGEGEHAIATTSAAKTIEVETARGDSIIEQQGLPTPTVLKIDVEGAELSVLKGMQRVINDSCRLVYVEVHPDKIEDFDTDSQDIKNFLQNSGFTVTRIYQRRDEYFLRATI